MSLYNIGCWKKEGGWKVKAHIIIEIKHGDEFEVVG